MHARPNLSRYPPCFQRCYCTKNYTHANLHLSLSSFDSLFISFFVYMHVRIRTHIHAPYDWLVSRATVLLLFSSPIKWAHNKPCRSYILQITLPLNSHFLEISGLEKEMEGGDQTLGNGGSRWNPTKEQINMLESLYKQGLRTPTAEQIQQITARLRDFGHIEGKNVFYWFQNHKARQRQKQKQESFAFYSRFLHATPVFPPYHQNVVCSPCYIPPPKNDPVYYHQHPNVQLSTASASFKRSRIIPEGNIQPTSQTYNTNLHSIPSSIHHQETLDLFPIHPTGVLRSRNDGTNHQSEIKGFGPSRLSTSDERERDGDHPFFDFFCEN